VATRAGAVALHKHTRAMATVTREWALAKGHVLTHPRMSKIRRFEPLRRVALVARCRHPGVRCRRLVARRADYAGWFCERIAVAFDAHHLLMLANQREPGLVVIHLGRLPTFRRVTRLAVCVPARMIGRGGLWHVSHSAEAGLVKGSP